MLYLASAFALNMLPGNARLSADTFGADHFTPAMGQYLSERGVVSVVGHDSTAAILSRKLGIDVPVNRAAIKLNYGDSVYVAQLGIRLNEGQVLTEEELANVPMSLWVVTVMRGATSGEEV